MAPDIYLDAKENDIVIEDIDDSTVQPLPRDTEETEVKVVEESKYEKAVSPVMIQPKQLEIIEEEQSFDEKDLIDQNGEFIIFANQDIEEPFEDSQIPTDNSTQLE